MIDNGSMLDSGAPAIELTTRDGLADPGAVSAGYQAGRLDGRARAVLFVLLGAQFLVSVDFSILNVALPSIGRGLGISVGSLQWVATTFALPAAGFTLLLGRVGDLVGRRRVFLAGLSLLAASSLFGGFATTPGALLVARALQGFATAMTVPSAMALLTTSFPEGPARNRALGLSGALLSGGFTAGALIGGVLTDTLSWRWAFLLNVPVAVAIAAVTPRLIRESRAPQRARMDVPGAVSVTAGLLAFVFGVSEAGHRGWSDPFALGSMGLGLLLLALFFGIESRVAAPLAPVRILSRPEVKWGNLGGLLVFSMESSVVYLMTLYLQDVLGYSPLVTGLVFGVPGIAAVVAGIVAHRIIGRAGARWVLVGGLTVQALANVALLATGHDRSTGLTIIMVALGIGFFGHVTGIVAYVVTATSGLPDADQGLATALSTLTQQVALTVGIPILSSVVAARASAGTATASADALISGVHTALAVDVGITLTGALLIAVLLRASVRS
ncbi:MAG: MFS transporter [Frankia sp.]